MRRYLLIGIALLLLPALLSAEFFRGNKKIADASAPRDLTGIVFDRRGHPAAGAVVYLQNTRNLAIYTYITGEDGSYRFNHLSPDIDYQVSAAFNGHKSDVKTLSSYDTHKQPRINLHLGK